MAAPAAPSGLAWLSRPSTLQAWRAGAEQRGPKQRELRGVGGGDGAEDTIEQPTPHSEVDRACPPPGGSASLRAAGRVSPRGAPP